MKTEDLKNVLDKHFAWLRGEAGGERADLAGANLRSADLAGADLRSANLAGANLRSADLSESRGFPYAQCSWTGHGECGRQLLAIVLPEGTRLFCGCFQGSPADLYAYIAAGAEEYRESRTKAFEFVMSCLP